MNGPTLHPTLTPTIHTDDIGIIVGNLTNEEVTLGIKQVFSRMAAEKLLNNARKRRKLPKRILRYQQRNYLNSSISDHTISSSVLDCIKFTIS